MSFSLYSLNGSKFCFNVPWKKNGCYGIIANAHLNRFKDNSWIFLSSIKIYPPLLHSINLNNATIIEDFPAPVLPIKATFSPGYISKLISFKTRRDSGSYEKDNFFTEIAPDLGQARDKGNWH